jgi:hypothetical protein
MPIPDDVLKQNLLPHIYTPRSLFEELWYMFSEQQYEDAYAVVRVGLAGYAVLSYEDLYEVWSQEGDRLLALPLGNIPALRVQQAAVEPIAQDAMDEDQARAHASRLSALTRRRVVVLDTGGAVAGVLEARGRTAIGEQPPVSKGPHVLGDEKAVPASQPYLNTRFEGVAPNQPLTVGQRTVLVISVGAPAKTNLAQSSRPFKFDFADTTELVTFDVHVDADPAAWTVTAVTPKLVVAPPGETRTEAVFMVTPLQTGRDKLHISIERADTGATVQHVWLPVMAAGEQAQVSAASLAPADEQVVVSTPFDSAQNKRRRVELTFSARAEGFAVSVRADMPNGTIRETYTVPISAAEIQNATLRLRQELEKIVFYKDTTNGQNRYPFADTSTVDIDEALARQVAVPLADAGRQYWDLLFHGPRAPEELRKLAEDIRDLPDGSSIQVVIESQQFIVPWGLLYDRPGRITADTLDWSGFWGYRYVLDVLPPGRYPAPHINETPLHIQLFFSDESNLQRFTGAQETFVRQRLADANTLTDQGSTSVEQRLAQHSSASLVYLYCHGNQVSGFQQAGSLASESALCFSRDTWIRLTDLRHLPTAPLQNAPLVFLNACEGSTQDAFYYDGFMPFFVEELGARGFVGTEVKAPQLLAHHIGLQFLKTFAGGMPVGQIFWQLRRYYLEKHHNILAFNYSLYCLSEVRLAAPVLREDA